MRFPTRRRIKKKISPVEVGMYPYDVPVSGEEDVSRGWIDIAINYHRGEVMREGDISTTLNFLLGNEGNERPHLTRKENRAPGEILSRSSTRPPPLGGFLPPTEGGSPTDNANIADVTAPSFARNSDVYEVDVVYLGRPFGFDPNVAQETDGMAPLRAFYFPIASWARIRTVSTGPPPTRPPTPARARNVPDRRALSLSAV